MLGSVGSPSLADLFDDDYGHLKVGVGLWVRKASPLLISLDQFAMNAAMCDLPLLVQCLWYPFMLMNPMSGTHCDEAQTV